MWNWACSSGRKDAAGDTETSTIDHPYPSQDVETDSGRQQDTNEQQDTDEQQEIDKEREFPVPVVLPTNVEYPFPGIITDDRAPWPTSLPRSGAADCSQLHDVVLGRQRTTLGAGTQLSVGVRDSNGFPLSSAAYANCLQIQNNAGEALSSAVSAAPASGALTLILAQPGATVEENQAIALAVNRFFLSRPRGERVAFFRWGATVAQVAGFTNFRDTFSDAVNQRFPLADEPPLAVAPALAAAAESLEEVAKNSHLWTRNLVVLAPNIQRAEIIPGPQGVNVLWVMKDIEGAETFNLLEGDFDSLDAPMGALSARLNAYNQEGFVTLGVCGSRTGDSELASLAVPETGKKWPVMFKAAKPEEMTGTCVPNDVANYTFYNTNVVELFVDGEAEETHAHLIEDSSRSGSGWKDVKTETFDASVQLSPHHMRSTAVASLRGSSSLRDCAPNRLSYTIDLEGGRERYLIDEKEHGIGSDEFYLIAMCLDPMYLNQLTAERLMQDIGVFRPALRLVEFKVQGQTQGAYILMEKVKESLVRNHSRVLSVIRRRNSGPDVKYPPEADNEGVDAAAKSYEELETGLHGLSGSERIAYLAPRLDLHRYMFFVALQSLLENGDWGDEPTFFATETIRADGAAPFFIVNGWDADDLLSGCNHSVMDDPYGLLGCAEHSFDRAVFGGDRVKDDEVYRMYVDALAAAIEYFTEQRVSAAFDRTAAELEPFARDTAITAVMESWQEVADVPAALAEEVAKRKADYAARRAKLQQGVADYYASHN